MAKNCAPYEASRGDKRADKGMREGSAADRKADAKAAPKRKVPARDGLAKYAKGLRFL